MDWLSSLLFLLFRRLCAIYESFLSKDMERLRLLKTRVSQIVNDIGADCSSGTRQKA